MKKPETILKEKVLKDIKKIPLCYAEKIQQVSKNGTLDIVLTINSFAVWLELTATEYDELKTIQTVKAFYHSRAGAYVFQVHPRNWISVKAKLYKLSDFKHLSRPKL